MDDMVPMLRMYSRCTGDTLRSTQCDISKEGVPREEVSSPVKP